MLDAVSTPTAIASSSAQPNLTHHRPNIWPNLHVPDLEPAFKELGKIMTETGLAILLHCDR
jgi:hypothetical protein